MTRPFWSQDVRKIAAKLEAQLVQPLGSVSDPRTWYYLSIGQQPVDPSQRLALHAAS